MNKACVKEYFSGFDSVELFFDEKRQRIGFYPIVTQSQDSYRLRKSQKSETVQISATTFLKHIKHIPSETQAYEVGYDYHNKLIFIDLNKVLESGPSLMRVYP